MLEAAYARWSTAGFDRPVDATGIFERGRQSERIRALLEAPP